ncbi:MAG: hypothetical protein ACR2LV_07250 [Solirubrobacteraceae bacterium]
MYAYEIFQKKEDGPFKIVFQQSEAKSPPETTFCAQLPRPLDAAGLNAGVGAGGAFATDTNLAQELKIVSRVLPDSVKAEMHRQQAEPGSA